MEIGVTAVISVGSNRHLFGLTILETEAGNFPNTIHGGGMRNKYKCCLVVGKNELVFDYYDSVHNYRQGIGINHERLVSDVLLCIVEEGLYYTQMDESETLTKEQWECLTRTNEFWTKVYGGAVEERLSQVSLSINTGRFVWKEIK